MPQSPGPRPTLQQAIADALRELRQKRNLSQEELGHRAGYDPIYINMLEKARRTPSIRAIVNICEALGTNPSSFIKKIEQRTGFAPRTFKGR
jgi:transcriptional regulator with XRE-family HTH domain